MIGPSQKPDVPPAKPWWRRLPKLRTFHDYWSAAVFLAAVVELILLRGLDIRVLAFFLLPPLGALLWKFKGEYPSTRITATAFLTLVSLGEFLKATPRLFPDLKGLEAGLSTGNARVLMWYCGVYCLFFFVVIPAVIFTRSLVRHYRGLKPEYRPWVCYLGLFTVLVAIGPIIGGLATELGFWPAWR